LHKITTNTIITDKRLNENDINVIYEDDNNVIYEDDNNVIYEDSQNDVLDVSIKIYMGEFLLSASRVELSVASRN